jgi:hypothetical protein
MASDNRSQGGGFDYPTETGQVRTRSDAQGVESSNLNSTSKAEGVESSNLNSASNTSKAQGDLLTYEVDSLRFLRLDEDHWTVVGSRKPLNIQYVLDELSNKSNLTIRFHFEQSDGKRYEVSFESLFRTLMTKTEATFQNEDDLIHIFGEIYNLDDKLCAQYFDSYFDLFDKSDLKEQTLGLGLGLPEAVALDPWFKPTDKSKYLQEGTENYNGLVKQIEKHLENFSEEVARKARVTFSIFGDAVFYGITQLVGVFIKFPNATSDDIQSVLDSMKVEPASNKTGGAARASASNYRASASNSRASASNSRASAFNSRASASNSRASASNSAPASRPHVHLGGGSDETYAMKVVHSASSASSAAAAAAPAPDTSASASASTKRGGGSAVHKKCSKLVLSDDKIARLDYLKDDSTCTTTGTTTGTTTVIGDLKLLELVEYNLPSNEQQRKIISDALKAVFQVEEKNRPVKNTQGGNEPFIKYSIVLLSQLVIADNLEAQSLNAQSQSSLTGGGSNSDASNGDNKNNVELTADPSCLLVSEVFSPAAMEKIKHLELIIEDLRETNHKLRDLCTKQTIEINEKNAAFAKLFIKSHL